MSYIYKPSGKALEYGELALNLYNGCLHGCKYCYVPQATHTDRELFHSPVYYHPRTIKEAVLDREIEKLRPNSEEWKDGKMGLTQPSNIPTFQHSAFSSPPFVFLCFTSDPYGILEHTLRITRRTIEKLHAAGIGVTILTKAAAPDSIRDFDLLAANPQLSKYGATLTFLDIRDSVKWEPNVAGPYHRLAALSLAHKKGIPTWASLEPVIDPAQTLELIRVSHAYVDEYKVGKWNHDRRANAIDWPKFAREAVELLDSLGKKYYIKEDLRRYL